MKLSKRVLRRLDADLVRRINEIYHNLENAQYDTQHDDISKFEAAFWRRAAKQYLSREDPVVWLDYGTGTGFVVAVIAEYLRRKDALICCDVSNEMLGLCEAKLNDRALPCPSTFRKIDGVRIPAEDQSVDVISVNSVLHHIFDLQGFAAECARVLKPSGLLVVAHEPNRATAMPFPGRLVRTLAGVVFRPKTLFFRLSERFALAEHVMRWVMGAVSPRYRLRNKMLGDIARQVKQENLLDFTLRGTEIQQIVDFHSQHGFDRDELLGQTFSGFGVVEFDTYGHLGFYPESRAAGAVERYLKRHWPDAGCEMCFVMKAT